MRQITFKLNQHTPKHLWNIAMKMIRGEYVTDEEKEELYKNKIIRRPYKSKKAIQ